MNKIKCVDINQQVLVHAGFPLNDIFTLCAEIVDNYDSVETTTDPITCPDCLQIISECQEIKLENNQ